VKFIVCDFGSAHDGNTRVVGYYQSRFYRSPESIFRQDCSYAIDMWGLGCVLYELLFNHVLFGGKNEVEQLHKIVRKRGMFTTSYIHNINIRKRTTYFKSITDYPIESSEKITKSHFSNRSSLKDQKKYIQKYILRSIYSNSVINIDNFWGESKDNIIVENLTKLIRDKSKVIKIDEDSVANFTDLILHMTEYEIHNRITTNEALRHRFMTDTKFSATTNKHLVYQDICHILDY